MPLILDVRLDPTANPPVIISDRRAKANDRDIVWRKRKNAGSLDFDFVRLDDLDQVNFPGQSIDEEMDRARCGNRAPAGATEYPYTIVVESGGVRYTSTETGAPPQDKPVIRN